MKGFRKLGEPLFSQGLTARLGLGTRMTAGGDSIAPTCTITCAQSSPSAATTLNFTITFSEVVTGFEVGDFVITNGTKGALGGSGAVYTCDVTPTGMSVVTANVAANVAQDAAGNNNTAATQVSITSTAPFSDTFTRGDGAIGSIWTGATWTISSNQALNTPTEGAEMWDAAASTFESGVYGWTPYGTNTVENDTNQLKITYVDNQAGAQDLLKNAADLSADLTVGAWYTFDVDARVGAGNNVTVNIYDTVFGTVSPLVTSTTLVPVPLTFRAGHAINCILRQGGMSAGEIIWLDNLSLKPLTLTSLFATLSTSVSDVTAQVVIAANPAGTEAGVVINLDSTSNPLNFVLGYIIGPYALLDKCVNGIYSNLIVDAVTFGATKNLKVIKDGDTYSLWYGTPGSETQVGANKTITGMNGTIHGIFSTHSVPRLDAFQLGPTNP